MELIYIEKVDYYLSCDGLQLSPLYTNGSMSDVYQKNLQLSEKKFVVPVSEVQ